MSGKVFSIKDVNPKEIADKILDEALYPKPKKQPTSVFSLRCQGYQAMLTLIVCNEKCNNEQKLILLKKLDIIDKVTDVKIIGGGSRKFKVKKNFMYVSAVDQEEATQKFLNMLTELTKRK